MSSTEWPVVVQVLFKLGLAVLLGGLIGYERERGGRPAGIRTHMLLVLGVTLFSEVSKAFGGGDQARIAAQVVTGVGFLGAGTILRLGAEIKGLTSAASLWAVSAIGMCVSVGGAYMWIAIFATILAFITLSVVDGLERRLVPNSHPRALNVVLTERAGLGAVLQSVEHAGAQVNGVRFLDEHSGRNVILDVKGDPRQVLSSVSTCPSVLQADWMA